MAYDKNTPLNINESFSVSQPKITANFQEIDNLLAVDHHSFGVNQGLHKKIVLTEQAADVSTGVDEMSIYTKDNAGTPNAFLRMENNGSIFNITPDASAHGTSGAETLPSGLKYIWGSGIANTAGTVITFADGGFPTSVYQVLISRNGLTGTTTDISVVYGSVSKTQFTAEAHNHDGTPSTAKISYFAIGK
jgi:hypothetical protein